MRDAERCDWGWRSTVIEARHGRFPEKLDELVPNSSSTVPATRVTAGR